MDTLAFIMAVGLVTVATTWYGLIYLCRYLSRRQFFDLPNARSSHTQPTPRGGGLAIVAVVLVGWLLGGFVFSSLPLAFCLAYFAPAALIAAVGWYDDLYSLSPGMRFGAQLLAAAFTVVGVGAIGSTHIPFLEGPFQLDPFASLLTAIWIVGVTNIYNFMDGIDGIAGSQGIAAGIGWTVLGILTLQPHVAFLGILLAAGCGGFLAHNWSPARIFMGDVGSTFLGYSFAAIPLLVRDEAGQVLPWALGAGVLLLWPFLFDGTFTLLRRLSRGENVFAAHRSHLYQRLVIAGSSHRFVASLYLVLAGVGGGLAAMWALGGPAGRLTACLALPLLCLGLWAYTALRKERAGPGLPAVTHS